MNPFSRLTLVALAAVALTSLARSEAPARFAPVAFGQVVPDAALREMKTGKTIKLSDYRGKVLVGIFMAGFCNNTWKHDKRIIAVAAEYKSKGVEFVIVHPTLHEIDDDLIDKAKLRGVDLPLLDDKKNQELVQKIDPECTPNFFVLDKNGALQYKGGFDDNRDPVPVKQYLRPVLDAVLAGKPVPFRQTTAYGCSIKRRV